MGKKSQQESSITERKVVGKHDFEQSGFREVTCYGSPLECLRNRQVEPPWTNRDTSENEDFFCKESVVISLSFYVDASPKDAL